MANVVVVGAQWGDEGKGKIVDWLSERADVIARFQGGHNAGHTLVIDGTVYKLHALPSGVVRGGKLSVIGNGVVLDPWHLVKEIEAVRAQGVEITPETLMIAENTPLILPIHGELDRAREEQTAVARIGTTGRGIGPAYGTRWADARSGWRTWRMMQRWKSGSTGRWCITTRCAAAWGWTRWTGRSCWPTCATWRPRCWNMPRRCGRC